MSQKDLTVRGLQEVFSGEEQVHTEIWEEAGVLEVILSDGSSMDFEEGNHNLQDPYSQRFLAANQVQKIFSVTLGPDNYELARVQMKRIVEQMGGFFCGDTDDFRPGIGSVHFI